MPEQRVPDLLATFPSGKQPPVILATTLAREATSDRWRVVTIWQSREALDEYRASVETPAALAAFRAAGVEPEITIWEADRVMIGRSQVT